MKKEISLKIYNNKKELEFDYNKEDYELIQKYFADYMFMKYVNKLKYRMSSCYNYDGTFKVIFIDTINKWQFVFDGISSDSLRWL